MDKWLLKVKSSDTEDLQEPGCSKNSNASIQDSVELTDVIELDESEHDSEKENAPKKRKTYTQKFKPEWKTQFSNWCRETENNKAYCTVCLKNIIGGITHISRHANTDIHKKNMKKAENTPKISTFLGNDEMGKTFKKEEAEFKCIMFLHEHNLPFLLMDHLPRFIKSVCSDSEIAKNLTISRTKATLITKDCFAPEAIMILTEKILQSAATKKLPNSLEELARGIYNFFSNSSRRQLFLHDCQSFLNEKPHKMLRHNQTRWLSLQMVVNRILEHWNSLILVFQDAVLAEKLQSMETVLINLRNPIFKVYFMFLSYVLEIMNNLNLEFQSEKSKIYVLKERISSLYKTILKGFIKRKYLEEVSLDEINPCDHSIFRDIDDCYFGAKTHILFSNENIDKNDILDFKMNAVNFYQELSTQIKSRFNFNDPVLTFCSYFEPQKAISGSVHSIAVESLKYFSQVVSDVNKLDFEWRLIPDCDVLKTKANLEFEEFWTNIFKMENELNVPMFPNLSKLVKCILSLPHSSASAERIFSAYNLIKTKLRNRLEVNTCDAILHAKAILKGETCYTWKPSKRLMNRKPTYR